MPSPLRAPLDVSYGRPPSSGGATPLWFALCLGLAGCAGCVDPELSPDTGVDAGSDAVEDAAVDAWRPGSDEDAAGDSASQADAGSEEAGSTDAAPEDAASEAGASDAGADDAHSPDASPEDASSEDASPGDTGPNDAGGEDAAEPPGCQPFVRPDGCETDPAVLPQSLRCTGLYADFAQRELACGVEPYTPAHALFSDGSDKHRFVALPAGTQVDVSDPDAFVYPVGTQFWKEFWVDASGTSELAETRLLRKTAVGWLYTSYVWAEDGSDAVQTNDGVPFVRGSDHSVPTRDACRQCHKGRPDFVLGWDATLLGEGAAGLTGARLLSEGWLHAGGQEPASDLFEGSVVGSPLEREALGYLHANCGVSCHNATPDAEAAETAVLMSLTAASAGLPASEADAVTTTVNRLPGIHAKVPEGGPYYDVRPGDPAHSLLWARMDVRGATQMPPIGTNVVDGEGVDLIRRWIEAMTPGAGYPAAAPVEDGLPGSDTPDAGVEDAGEPDAGVEDAGTPDAGEPDVGVPPVDAGTGPDCGSAPTAAGLGYQVVVQSASLETLTYAAQPPGSDDWYLVEMRGRILRLRAGALEPEPFLDVREAIDLGAGFDQTTLTYDERGLVGLEFAPDFATSGRYYVAITPSRRNNSLGLPYDHDMVIEYEHQDGGMPENRVVRTLVDAPSASSFLGNIHNINTVRFGPDGMLYVGMGDGGGVRCADAENNPSQDVSRVYGKILRLDPSLPAPHAAAGNPFAGAGDARVLHYGLRNPFRFSFDRATGDLYLGDVGQDTWEELDFAPAGAQGLNFGWARFEANADCPSAMRPLRAGSVHTPPIFAAHRRGNGPFSDYRAIVGGAVYRGEELPALEGAYLFGDYYGTRLGLLYQCGAGATSPIATLRKVCDPNFPEACLKSPAAAGEFRSLTAIVEDHAGELYFVANGDRLLRLVDASAVP